MDAVGQPDGSRAIGRVPLIGLSDDRALIDQPAQDFLKEEGIALGGLAYLAAQRLGHPPLGKEPRNEVG